VYYLQKNYGRKNNKCSKGPYEPNDFNSSYVFPNNNKKFIWLIPMNILIDKGYIRTKEKSGYTALSCFNKDYERPIRAPGIDLWTQDYCYDCDDRDTEERIIKILSEYIETLY